MKEAAKFAESTQILMNVSEFTDVSQATDTLISAVQAFEYTAETSMNVVDLLNTIGNNYAISTADLAQSLTKSSASLVAAGGDLAEAAALTATANAIIQDADAVGTALKTTSLRLRGTSVDVLEEEGIDSDGAITSKSKLQSKVKAISGVDILTETGEYKSTYQILSQIADVWEDISDIDQAALLEMLAGKRNASVLAAILQAPEELKAAYEDANNASGSALKENEKYLDSIQGRMDVFANSVQTMWNNVIGSDAVKWFVTLGTTIIQVIDKVGLLNTALIALGAFKGGKFLLNVLSGMGFSFKDLTARLSQYLIGVNAATVATHQLTQAQLLQKLKLTGLTDEMAAAVVAETGLGVSTKTLSAEQLKAALIAKGYSEELANETVQKVLATATTSKLTFTESLAHTQLVKTLATRALVRAAQKQGITLTEAEIAAKLKDMTANQLLSMSFKELGVSIVNVGKKILPLIAAIAAIAAVVWVVDELTTTTEEAKEAFDEFNSVLSETESQLDELESQLSDINSQIEELNSQGALTFTDREELQRLKAQSNEIQRQIDLTENLKKQQQTQVNGAALTMADMYEDVGMTTGKTTEELKSTGGTGGAIIGGAGLGIAGAMGAGASIGIAGGPVGLIVGAVVGAIVGAIIGVAGGAAVGAAEEKVGDSLDNMKKQYEKLQSEYNAARANYQKDASEDNKEKFEEAQEAFNSYQSNMANYMTEMNSYYSQIKANWDVATEEQKQAYNEWADTMDTWAIQTGGQNAKSNALDRLFGENAEGGFAIARDRVDEIKEKLKDAQETGDELAIANALKELEDFKLEGILSEEEVERLRNLGLYLYEAEDRFKDVVKTESEFINNDLEDVAKDINKITEGFESLKSAFEEVLEEEVLTAKTLKSLKEELKIESSYSDVTEVQDAWRNYLDTMMSGAATTEEMTKKTEELAQAILDAALAKNDLKPETKYEYIAQLRQLGVANAEEYVDDLLQKNMVQEIESFLDEGDKYDLGSNALTLSEEDKQRLIETYNIEEDALDAIITKLHEKKKLEQDIADKQKEKSDYEAWRNGDGTNKGILALQEEVDNFNPNEWERYQKSDFTYGYRRRIGEGFFAEYEKISTEEFVRLTEELPEQLENLKSIGKEKRYIIDGKIVNPDFQAEIDGLQNQIDGITTDIDENITIDIDLKLKLQDKSELVDDIQNTFDTLVNAQKEYDENGYVSVDTLQSLLELEPKYLDLLVDEKGNLNLTKDALYNVARARIMDMGIQQQKNILEKANQLASKGSTDALREQITVMQGANAEGKNFIDTQMEEIRVILQKRVALGDLSQAEADAFIEGTMNQIEAVQVTTQLALDNLENSLSSAGNTAKQETEDAFKKAMDYWENRIGANQSLYEQIQNDIDLLEKKGQIAGESYYQAQIDVEKEHLQHLKDQRDEATEFLKGEKRGTERWWEIANTLNDIEGEIDSVTLSIQDLSDAMAQVHWDVFDQAHERMDDLTAQLSNVREILSADEDSFFTDEGEWSDTGIAVLATHIQDIAVAESTLADVEKELKNLKMSDFDSENEYYDKLIELTEKQQDYTMAISDSKQAVVDMYESNIDAVEEYFDKLIENYSDYIDSVKEALNAEKDLYEFTKNIQKQSKDIAEIERRIASLSGSTNASEVAERRKLEAELYESRESLNDTYYDHAKQSQQDALDAEQTAYEETLTKMVEGMRTSLKEATTNMQAFLDSVTIAVSRKADTVLNKYQSTELYLSPALTNPWEAAKKAVGEYGGDANNLMDVWAKDGYFAKFSSDAGTNLKSPFDAGKTAVDEFGKSVGKTMTNVYTSIQSNIQKSVTELDKIKQKYNEINDTTLRAPSTGNGGGGGGGGGEILLTGEDVSRLQQILNKFFSAKLAVNGIYDSATKSAVANMQASRLGITPNGLYDQKTKKAMQDWLNKWKVGSWFQDVGFGIPAAMYAKGTTGTTHDQWAITDEPKFGDELVLVPGKDGNLSFVRKGTGIVPADMTQKLFELAQIPTSDLMNKNLTAIVPNITKNDFKNEFNFESLVHVDTVDSDTLPKLEKMVDKKIDDFSKALNYSIKRFTR